ncbi:M4 family metallopeptidase [Streptomyces sp. NRRL F-525]|uniref:M4 family metallopeptidase n=1 Tax=Streptomyces sp. NRRL F-525 TaxID=1463861 RepID=UPI000526DACD|nr:M4 family metallopeptidase [Streptomyces sp. NRRL F-525]
MRSNSSRRRTSHIVAVAGVTALLAAAVQAGATSSAAPANPLASKGNPAHMALSLSPSQRAELLRDAASARTSTAKDIGLGTKEALVVRDVVKDADGTVHTRYERTYGGLPVLGGDLVVDTAKSGATERVIKATNATIAVADLTPDVTTAAAEKQAVSRAKALGSTKSAADSARKVIWAASGKPVLAYETVVGGLQDDGTPNELHVITDAATGKKLYEYQGIENATGTGNTQYSGSVPLTTTQSGSNYTLTDGDRGGHKTYNLNHGTSGTGTLFSQTTNTWGNGTTSNAATAGADAHYGAAETWDFYKNTFGRSGIKNNGVGAYSRVHYGNSYVNAFWDDSCFCMTYGDGSGNADPLTALDVAGHEMSHGVTSNTAGLNYSGESGGLNEATSDIFGTGVEFYANNSTDVGDYLIGEKIDINGDGTPLRYMDKPSKDGGSADSRALTTKFTSTTNYAAARTGTLAAAGELYGTTGAEYKAVQDAWAAVAVGARSGGGGGGGTSFENTADVSIPDNGAAVTSSVTVSGRTGNAPSNLSVTVDIVHTWRGDLVIDLVAPDGSTYRLKNSSSSDSADNVQATYTVNASSEVANGVWKLKVQDVAAQDTGYINSWKLTFP